MANEQTSKEDLLALTANIVSSHVANNKVELTELPLLIERVFHTLSGLDQKAPAIAGDLAPAVPIKKSITPDYLICLEDGKKLKMLKRHLKSQYGMSPEDYRLRWSLGADYPMVAPNYAAKRRVLAKKIGLGKSKKL